MLRILVDRLMENNQSIVNTNLDKLKKEKKKVFLFCVCFSENFYRKQVAAAAVLEWNAERMWTVVR